MTTKLKSSKEKTTAAKAAPDTQGINYELLLQIHKDTHKAGFSWVSAGEVRDKLQLRAYTLTDLISKYGIPVIHLNPQTQPIVSLPALEHVLANATLLHQTGNDDTAAQRLQTLKEESEAQFRAETMAQLESKFNRI